MINACTAQYFFRIIFIVSLDQISLIAECV